MATPKKKHLIELMIEAGVKWPDGAEYAAQDKNQDPYGDNSDLVNIISFYTAKPTKIVDDQFWLGDDDAREDIQLPSLCRNWHQTIVTREQYADAVAATAMTPAAQQETQPDGEWEPVEWGDWSIGDTVRFDGFTDTRHSHWSFKVGVLYVIGKHNAPIAGNCQYPERNWGFSFSRLKKQNEQHIEAQSAPEYCASVMRQMPDNTIEQLTTDYHIKAAEADRLQVVADDALKAADDALLALQKAGKLIGLVISVDTMQKLPVQSEITDWSDLRVGDVIECIEPWGGSIEPGDTGTITGIYGVELISKFKKQKNYSYKREHLGVKFRFIHRP